MNVQTRLQEDRRKTNPVFNDRKLKLGTFGTNLDRGCAISTIRLALTFSSWLVVPSGHLTSTESAWPEAPRPKCARMSSCEM